MKSNSRISLVVAASLTVLGGASTPAIADNASDTPVPTSGAEWFSAGRSAIEANKRVNRELNTRCAKNVILFVGDGMGVSTVTAARSSRTPSTT
jgi:alkaline phosphatase